MKHNGKAKKIDTSRAAYTLYGSGVKRGNPKRCIHCGEKIQQGETWRVDWSEADPNYLGRYATIQHSPKCPNVKAQQKFQAMLKVA